MSKLTSTPARLAIADGSCLLGVQFSGSVIHVDIQVNYHRSCPSRHIELALR